MSLHTHTCTKSGLVNYFRAHVRVLTRKKNSRLRQLFLECFAVVSKYVTIDTIPHRTGLEAYHVSTYACIHFDKYLAVHSVLRLELLTAQSKGEEKETEKQGSCLQGEKRGKCTWGVEIPR